ncbi:MAG: OmpA family protein, partial [Ghiorsea sp.]|nr:OmpA family protein [Ghiorsea sp.]
LQQDGKRSVLIVGHSDSSGNMYANRRLSVQRAKTVANIFVKAGFSPTEIFFQGVGEYEPIQSNKTKFGRAANRRIEVIEASSFSYLAKVRLQTIKKSKSPKSVLSATMLLKNMKGQFYVLPMYSKSFQASVRGHSFTVQRLLNYGVDSTSTKKKKKSLLSTFSAFFEPHTEGDGGSKYSRIPNILGDSAKPALVRLEPARVQALPIADWQLGYEAKVAPLTVWLPHGEHLDIPAFPISKDDGLVQQTPILMLYAHPDSTKAIAEFKGYDKLYKNENRRLYRWRSSAKTLVKSGFLGLDILLKSFDESDFKENHVEKLQGLLYYVVRGKVMVAVVDVSKHLLKKVNIRINIFKSFLPI